MKLSREEAEKFKGVKSAGINNFTKLADFDVPDSPPPEEKVDPKEPNKFDQMMRAACSIKSAQLEQQRKKFELLPTFLKAGVYYTQKHEVLRRQENFDVKYFAYQLLKNDANSEFAQGHFDRACRKYEESLSVFRYFEATDASWQDKGIDDDKLHEVDYLGKSPEEQKAIRQIKLNTYLNISACNIKVKSYTEAVLACEEALKLDPTNLRALYRRARATSLPINAGVPDLRRAQNDLEQILRMHDETSASLDFVVKEQERVQQLIDINYKRE